MRRGRVSGVLFALVVAASACTAGPVPSPPETRDSDAGPHAILAARAAHTATALGDATVLVAGGCNRDGCTSASTSTVVLAPGGATEVAPLGTARDAHTATLLDNGQVIVTGGFSAEGRPPLASAEVFDPTTHRWTPTSGMALGRGGHAAARLGSGRVIVAGGWVGPRRYTAGTEIYDPRRSRFEAGPALPEPVDGLAATPLVSGEVLVAGGQTRPGVATATAVLVSRDGRTVQQVGPLRTARFKHAMVGLASGRVLVIGGTSDDRSLLASTEIYDPTTRRFEPGPTMSAGRYKLAEAAAALPDGRVVVAGGGPGLEVIDVRGQTSRPVPDTEAVYAAFSTASVVGDDLRVVGGYDRTIRLTGTDLTIPLAQLG